MPDQRPPTQMDLIRANPPKDPPSWWRVGRHGEYPPKPLHTQEVQSMPTTQDIPEALASDLTPPPVMKMMTTEKRDAALAAASASTEGVGPGRWDYVEDADKDEWVKTWIPAGSGVVGSEDIQDHVDTLPTPLDLGDAWDKGRGQEMHAYWAHTNTDYNEKQRKQGYKPVRPENVPAAMRMRFQTVKHPQMGQVLAFGDVVLMECPKGMWEKRVAAQSAAQKRDEFERKQGAIQDMDDKAKSAVGSADDASVTPYQMSQSYDTNEVSLDSDLQAEINSIDEAVERQNAAAAGKSTFGGLTGPMDRRPDSIGPPFKGGYVSPRDAQAMGISR